MNEPSPFDPLILCGRHAKWVLAGGLVVALLLPGVAQMLAQWLVPLIMLIMFVGALRLHPKDIGVIWAQPARSLRQACKIQLLVPLVLMGIAVLFGLREAVWMMALVLVFSAPPIVSSPNIAGIMGLDAANSMRLVIWGTVLVPLTAIPTLLFLFRDANVFAVFQTAGQLAAVILLSGGLGIVVRRYLLGQVSHAGEQRLNGLSALALAIFVVALMPALQSGLTSQTGAMLGWIALAFIVNFGTHIALYGALRAKQGAALAGSYGLAMGNRNFALFFAALAADQTGVFLPFLAAYQIPMYLTPILLAPMYRSVAGLKA